MQQFSLTRRESVIALSGAILVSSFAFGWRDKANAMPSDFPKERMLELFDNAAWVPIGPKTDKIVYVMAAPWCPYCKALFLHIRGAQMPVQFRWIFAWPRDGRNFRQNAAIAYYRDAA